MDDILSQSCASFLYLYPHVAAVKDPLVGSSTTKGFFLPFLRLPDHVPGRVSPVSASVSVTIEKWMDECWSPLK